MDCAVRLGRGLAAEAATNAWGWSFPAVDDHYHRRQHSATYTCHSLSDREILLPLWSTVWCWKFALRRGTSTPSALFTKDAPAARLFHVRASASLHTRCDIHTQRGDERSRVDPLDLANMQCRNMSHRIAQSHHTTQHNTTCQDNPTNHPQYPLPRPPAPPIRTRVIRQSPVTPTPSVSPPSSLSGKPCDHRPIPRPTQAGRL